jgi:uncharacterized DUF497 family protein
MIRTVRMRGSREVPRMSLRFTWDTRKAVANLRKHGVSFHEAATAFADPLSITVPDPDHSTARPASRHERLAYEEED